MVQKYKKFYSRSSYGIEFSCTLHLVMLFRSTLKLHAVSYYARSVLLRWFIVLCLYIIKYKKIIKYIRKWQNISGNDLLFLDIKSPTLL